MPDRPLLVFPKSKDIDPPKRHGFGGGGLHIDNKTGQAQRVYEQFGRVLSEFQSDDSSDIEKILVIETIGAISDFYNAVRKIDGLEWLAEMDIDEIDADWDFLYGKSEKGKKNIDKAKKWEGDYIWRLVINRRLIDCLVFGKNGIEEKG